MRRSEGFCTIRCDFNVKALFNPSAFKEERVYGSERGSVNCYHLRLGVILHETFVELVR